MLRVAILTAVSFFIGHALLAQGTVSSPMIPYQPNFDALKNALSLTDTQVQQLQQMQKDRMEADRAVGRQLMQKQKDLNDLLNSGQADALTVGQMQIDIASMRKQTQDRASLRDRALALLDPGQRAKLGALEDALKLQRAASEAINLGLVEPPPVQPLNTVVPAAR